jgi:hypothetical protein
MFQLRIYTLRSHEALQQYAVVHWDRHPPGVDPERLTGQIMTSPEFSADMAGFDVDEIVDVQTTLLDPTSFSPIR